MIKKFVAQKTITHPPIFILLLCLSLQLSAQFTSSYSDFRFNIIGTTQGLSQSSALSLCQDSYGFIWIGTKDGLNRYDGYAFEVFKNDPINTESLNNNEITVIQADPKGNLLVGTRGGGLNKYIYSKNKFVRASGGMPTNTTVGMVYFENDTTLWVGTNSGLFKGYANDTTDFGYQFENVVQKSIYRDIHGNIIPHTKEHVSVISIFKLAPNRFLVGTEYGLFQYNENESVFKKIDLGDINENKVVTIINTKENEFVFGTWNGVAISRYEANNFSITHEYNLSQKGVNRLNNNWVNTLIADHNGQLWGGTRGGGLFKIDSAYQLKLFKNNQYYNGMTDHSINTLLIDKTGVLWIGTESRGCYQLDLNRKKFNHFDPPATKINLNENRITAITGDGKNTLFAGTALNGINKITFNDNQNYTITPVIAKGLDTERNNEIISLLFDSHKNLWFGSSQNEISRIDANNQCHTYTIKGFVFTIYEDKEGTIWYGTWGNGFGKIDPQTYQLTSLNNTSNNFQSLSNDKVISLLADSDGNLWIGTKGGGLNVSPINLLNQGLSSFYTYNFDPKNKTSLSHNDVYCIFQDSRGNIWVGTGNGLNKLILDKQNQNAQAILQGKASFVSYTETDGLPSNVIYGILEDDEHNLWVSTLNGLAKINPDSFSVTSYGVNDGLQDNEFHANSCFMDDGGNMFFGGIQGISFFNPDQIRPNPYPANIVITGLNILSQKVKPDQEVIDRIVLNQNISATNHITLGPKHKEFTLEFSGMHFSNTNNVRYAYRMLGFNDEWRETRANEHTATYTNLFEGDYVFQVKATNNDGLWSDEMAELNITIKPVIWRNPWFFIFYLCLIITMLFFFRKYSVIGVKEKNKLKIEALERKKAIELTESKMRFFTNISHEIRTPLTLIYAPLEKVIESENLPAETKNSLMLVKKNVSRLLNLTNQLLQLRKIDIGLVEAQFEKVHFIPYIKDILEYFDQQIKRKGINITTKFSFSDESDEIWIDKEMLTTAIYNLISNAYKYTPTGGAITITAYQSAASDDKRIIKRQKKDRDPQRYLFVEISDNGTGIPAKELPNVFKRFYQASNQEHTDQAGSGIGLSIVKEYVEMHKGYISVNSTQGKGTTFLLQLPLDNYHIQPHQFKEGSASGSKIFFPPSEPLYEEPEKSLSLPFEDFDENDTRPLILVVEDDTDMLNFLTKTLNEKYRVIGASNGKKAVKLILNYSPNLVITDVMMPEMDGRELCQYIKTNIETCHIPIILLSAQAGNDDIITGYEQGADRYISKPFDVEVLLAQVNQLLTTRKQLIDLYSKKILLKPREITITSMDEKFLTRIMNIIEDNLADSEFDITKMVDKMNMSHSSVLKKIKALTGVSLVEFVRRHRLNKAAMIFQQEKLPVTEVAYMTGFSDPKYFSKCFSKQFGKTPTEYIEEHEKEQ